MNKQTTQFKKTDMQIRINLKEPISKGADVESDLLSFIDSHLKRSDLSTGQRIALGRIRQRVVVEFII